MYNNIYDLYTEKWKETKKPFQVNEYLQKKLKIGKDNSAERYVSNQPIMFIAKSGAIKYNRRKLSELPYCMTNANSKFDLEKVCELIFFNYDFLQAKFSCEQFYEIQEDLKAAMNKYEADKESAVIKYDYQQLRLFKQFLKMVGLQILNYPDSLAFQFTSRMLGFGGQSHVKSFIEECDKLSTRHCSFIAPYLQQEPPGGYLLTNLDKAAESIIKICFIKPLLVTYSDSKIMIYSVKEINSPKFLFSVNLPGLEQLLGCFFKQGFFERNKIELENLSVFEDVQKPRIKVIIGRDSYFFDPETDSDLFKSPDLFLILFLAFKRV